MWEIIQANKRKSVALVVLLAVVLMGLGYTAGYFWGGDGAGIIGVLAAMVIWTVMMLAAVGGGERVLLATAGAREVKREDAPQLYNIVEEMKIASGLPRMPRIFIIDSRTPNAFAVGLKPERAAVAVTTGLLARLTRDELQGVIGHELGHINNRDTLFMTLAGVTVGAVIILADLFLRGLWFSSGRRRSSRNDGQLALVMMILAIVLAILAPLMAQILYFACSRRREYLADACSAQYTRFPQGLASALAKIAGQSEAPKEVNRVLAPMYIVNPLAAAGSGRSLFSTHPPVEERIRVLQAMGSDVSLAGYQAAFAKVQAGEVAAGVGRLRGLKEEGAEQAEDTRRWREARDILHRADGYRAVKCGCGLTIRIPPGFDQETIVCPRCGRTVKVGG